MSDMKKQILDYVIDEYVDDEDDAEDLDNTSPLISSGLVDSFSMVSLKRFLEKTFGVAIPDAEATPDAFDSVDSIAALVSRFQE